jgi:hypothetical protein
MSRILIALLGSLAWAGTQASSTLVVQPPPGWLQRTDPATQIVSLIPPGVPSSQTCAVLVFPARDATGPAQGVLDQLVRNATSGWQLFGAPAYLDLGPFRVAVFSQQSRMGTQHMAIHVARWGSRSQAIAFVATDAALFQAHGPTVQAMLNAVAVPAETFTFRNTPTVARQPAAPAKSLVLEAYRRPGQRTWMNIDGSTFTGKVQYERIALLANGVADFQLYHATGLAADRELLSATPATLNGFYGSWRADGNTIRLRRQAGQPEEVMTRQNGNLVSGGTVWTPTPRLDGLRLSGRYAYKSEPGGPMQYNYWVQFSEDGRFQTGGVLMWLAVSDMTGRPRPPDPASGTYEIRDWTLFFIVNGAPVWSTEIMPVLDDVRNPATILIDTYPFRRQ